MEDDYQKDMQANETPAEGVSEPTPKEVSAEVVTIKGSAKRVNAQTVNVDGGQVRMLRGETVNVNLKNGGIGSVRASEATVKAPSVGFVMASNAQVEGKVGFVFDVRAGLVAGIAGGLVVSALRLVFGRRRTR